MRPTPRSRKYHYDVRHGAFNCFCAMLVVLGYRVRVSRVVVISKGKYLLLSNFSRIYQLFPHYMITYLWYCCITLVAVSSVCYLSPYYIQHLFIVFSIVFRLCFLSPYFIKCQLFLSLYLLSPLTIKYLLSLSVVSSLY